MRRATTPIRNGAGVTFRPAFPAHAGMNHDYRFNRWSFWGVPLKRKDRPSAALAIGGGSVAPFALNLRRRVADSMADFPPVRARLKAKRGLPRLSVGAGRSSRMRGEATEARRARVEHAGRRQNSPARSGR